MKKMLFFFVFQTFLLNAQKAPVIGITTFSAITEFTDDQYENDFWITNLEDTGWDFTAVDANGVFNLKKFIHGGPENYDDRWISLDNLSISVFKIKSNDGSPFSFKSLYIRPDFVVDFTIQGYYNGVPVPGAIVGYKNNAPEKWTKYEILDHPEFGYVNELRIAPNNPLHLLGIDNIEIGMPELAVSEGIKSDIQLFSDHKILTVKSNFSMRSRIYSSDGKKIGDYKINQGFNTFDLFFLPAGIYIISGEYENRKFTKKFLLK